MVEIDFKMINYEHGTVGYVLTLISLIHGSFTSVISFLIVAIIIYHLYNNRLKRDEKMTFLLSANIYLLIFIFTTVLISFNVQTLLGDVYGTNFDSSWCTFSAYFSLVIMWAFYYAFVIQAFYRLCRIVYWNYRGLQLFWFYVIIVPVQVGIASVLMCPLLIWRDIIYLPNESYCLVSFTNIRSTVWVACVSYGLPLTSLSLIYIRITLFLHQQSQNLTVAINRRQQRDLLAVQRIFINVGLLIVLGLPGIGVLMMSLISGVEYPLCYRILWTGSEVSLALLSMAMFFMTPQLKNIVIKRWQQNRVATCEGPIQMRPVTTAQ